MKRLIVMLVAASVCTAAWAEQPSYGITILPMGTLENLELARTIKQDMGVEAIEQDIHDRVQFTLEECDSAACNHVARRTSCDTGYQGVVVKNGPNRDDYYRRFVLSGARCVLTDPLSSYFRICYENAGPSVCSNRLATDLYPSENSHVYANEMGLIRKNGALMLHYLRMDE